MVDMTATSVVSKSAWLELREERELVRDGYEFLDEKRVLLAAEILRQRDAYNVERKNFVNLAKRAREALVASVADLGLEGVQTYPVARLADGRVSISRRASAGLQLLAAEFEPGERRRATEPVQRSGAANDCQKLYRDLLELGAALAARSGNLMRLTSEYRRVERRVRALENIILPEIQQTMTYMEEHLDLNEQEEIIRVRYGARSDGEPQSGSAANNRD